MLGLKDGAGSEDGYGYLDIEDFIIRNCTETEEIIESVKEALKDWQKAAKRFGTQERDINLL